MSFSDFIKTQSFKRKSPNLTKLGFDFNNADILSEYTKLQMLLSNEYLILCESMLTIMEKYSIPSAKTLHDLFKVLDIESRSLSSATSLGVLQNRVLPPTNPIYTRGWHSAWNGTRVYLRSSYEFTYAKMLDEAKIAYDVECLRIKYYSTEYNRYRVAIPDFLLSQSNTIVEIKSTYTYNKQEMIDKFLSYKALGFNCKLVLDGVETAVE